MNTIKQQLEYTASFADLTPRIASLLQRFFLDMATKDEELEIDEWMNASKGNESLFDLLVEVNRNGTGAGSMALLMKLAKRTPRKPSRLKKYLWLAFWVILAILFLDYFIPGHPLSRLFYGSKPADRTLTLTTVTTTDSLKTIWLPDSTRVDLMPHSSASFPNDLSWQTRKLTLNGDARVTVRAADSKPFELQAGPHVYSTNKATTIQYEHGKLTVEPPIP
jgi:ferric-dicitrate binding protein FerR (iron transport regulator)